MKITVRVGWQKQKLNTPRYQSYLFLNDFENKTCSGLKILVTMPDSAQ